MTHFTPPADWLARLAANPTAQCWLQYAEELRGELSSLWLWERRFVGVDDNEVAYYQTIDRSTLPAHQQPPYLAELTARMIWMLDERSHGWMHGGRECDGGPTFALLLDRPGEKDCSICCNRRYTKPDDPCLDCLIPGHLTELAQWMTDCGDPRGEEVGRLAIEPINRGEDGRIAGTVGPIGQGGFIVTPGHRVAYYTFPDAARELLRRLREMLTEPCEACSPKAHWRTTHFPEEGPCPQCAGLGWRVRT